MVSQYYLNLLGTENHNVSPMTIPEIQSIQHYRNLGPLIQICGSNGPQVTGINSMATVSQVAHDSGWLLPRGRHPLTVMLRACLENQTHVLQSQNSDCYLWRNTFDSPPGVFSSSKTWENLHQLPDIVPWHKTIWFKQRIPKHAFLAWISIRDRLPTRDRLIAWGMDVPSSCLLCSAADESRDHLFWSCSFSLQVWNTFFSRTNLNPPVTFEAAVSWIRSCSANVRVRTICNLLLHAVCYVLWKERNARYHTSVRRPAQMLIKDIQLILRAKLYGLDRNSQTSASIQSLSSSQESYIHAWFRCFHPLQ
ncbi:hypothetical protein Bca4012_022307 [Brassica carinata]